MCKQIFLTSARRRRHPPSSDLKVPIQYIAVKFVGTVNGAMSFQNSCSCSSVRNCIAYANDLNIVNKDSPKETKFRKGWSQFCFSRSERGCVVFGRT